eukprot:GDKI01031669.1.p1 GENE.GDKI01031669.1~~GDKI01031669.1.p1  ORF type:complete len:131 (-),score=39.27 GDKI01031669.1:364-756(-)
MAVTVPFQGWGNLLYKPPSVGADAANKQLQAEQMKFDPVHYDRAYLLCRGKGNTHQQCRQLPEDTYITPQNPLVTAFEKEIVDGVECMIRHRDDAQCQHHFEGLYRKLSWQAPKPTAFQKVTGFVGKLFA